MIGKASEIKTKRVFDTFDTKNRYLGIDEMINHALSELQPNAEILKIEYQAVSSNSGDNHYALIIYKEAKEDE
ncbi:hypothetical protein P4H94_26810 [Paenibacillus macerans]|uniref:Sporulation protein Cse60 n=1 Tax=Paenibacillus macerans TaxID=44252 RepID=A0A6N8F5V1_PAEMA|nr:hypothetical protein [Paenibacillus macerans]MDU5945482.1 hypothetical protein [Paenibacillus macerans]MEC0140458.1 hypothetical protein [Paenibacillus macerans]MUG26031.1 hypothetical protein [Paenibacillus macerans]